MCCFKVPCLSLYSTSPLYVVEFLLLLGAVVIFCFLVGAENDGVCGGDANDVLSGE